MVKLAIRDDDANFFTKVEDIEFVYKDFEGFPISFAVVPHVMDVSTKGTCSDTKGNTTPRDIDKNIELCLWFREKYVRKECDILLHGITHQYKVDGNIRYPEMIWSGMSGNKLIIKNRVTIGFAYPGVLKYSDHLEINACALRSLTYLKALFDYCDKNNLPMVVNVHYWHLRDNPEYLEMLRSFVMDYAIPKGAQPTLLSNILK